MRIPSAERLVRAWEAGAGLLPTDRALELLAAGEPDLSRPTLAGLPIGERDRRLLHMRRALFGPALDATVVCPSCAARVEFEIELASLLLPSRDIPDWNPLDLLDVDGGAWAMRLPTSSDLLAIGDVSVDAAALALLERCVTRVDEGPPTRAAASATGAIRSAVAAKMVELDPQADIQLSVACPSCQRVWLADFDIVSFLWAELTTWVRRLLLDVHRLASAYGWQQADIIAMSSQRRSAYLEMIGA